MNVHKETTVVYRSLVITASIVIVVAGLRAAQSIVVPMLLSIFIALIVLPALNWLKKRKVPTSVAVGAICIAFILGALVFATLIGSSVSDFNESRPVYELRLKTMFAGILDGLESYGFAVPREAINEVVDLGAAIGFVGDLLQELGGMFANAMLIFFAVLFMLFEAAGFPSKLREAIRNSGVVLSGIDRFSESLKQYMLIKTVVSFATGLTVVIFLSVMGVDFPFVWGILAFLLNYIPTIGSIVAAVPAVLLSLVQFDPGVALLVAGGFVVINVFYGNVLEPKFMGQKLGLSTLVVFLSLVMWGWVFGMVGALLSVPLTMTLKIAFESCDETRWIAVLLGPEIQEVEIT